MIAADILTACCLLYKLSWVTPVPTSNVQMGSFKSKKNFTLKVLKIKVVIKMACEKYQLKMALRALLARTTSRLGVTSQGKILGE